VSTLHPVAHAPLEHEAGAQSCVAGLGAVHAPARQVFAFVSRVPAQLGCAHTEPAA
jgi:hypothetical protein